MMLITVLTLLALWRVMAAHPPGTAEHVRQGGSLRVGFAPEAPYAFYDADGEVTGEAPETFRLLARRMGIQRIDWVRLDFAQLLPELQLGRIDAIASGLFITPARQKLAVFSLPTARVRAALVVRQGERRLPLRPTLESLRDPAPLQLATIHDAAENELLRGAGVGPQRIVSIPGAQRALQAVQESTVDAFAISAVTARHLVAQHPGEALEVRTLVDAPPGLPAFAFRLDDADLRDAMNQQLARFIGTQEHRQLVERFGFSIDELPPSAQGAP